jgi:hypothetical protein
MVVVVVVVVVMAVKVGGGGGCRWMVCDESTYEPARSSGPCWWNDPSAMMPSSCCGEITDDANMVAKHLATRASSSVNSACMSVLVVSHTRLAPVMGCAGSDLAKILLAADAVVVGTTAGVSRRKVFPNDIGMPMSLNHQFGF